MAVWGLQVLLEHPILLATENNHFEVVKYLLEQGADPQFRGKDGKAALHIAARIGSLELVKLLLKQPGVSSDDPVEGGSFWFEQDTSIPEAAYQGHQEVVEYLLLNSMESNAARIKAAASLALPSAVSSGKDGIVKSLLANGADINFQHVWRDDRGTPHYARPYRTLGTTPLLTATRDGQGNMVRLLLTYGADVRPYLKGGPGSGLTALHLAVLGDSEKYINMLLHHGNLDLKSVWGCAHVAAYHWKLTALKLLLSKIRSTQPICDPLQEDLLVTDIKGGDSKIVKFLLHEGFDGKAALIEAIKLDREELVNLFLQYGTYPDAKSGGYSRAVCAALGNAAYESPRARIVEKLLHAGAQAYSLTTDHPNYNGYVQSLHPTVSALMRQFPSSRQQQDANVRQSRTQEPLPDE
ncbi:ankyrin repeat-containing domain protein [Aspergillus stella-maris]|uniref:ankyrin repeat-containing domain protein n=1 Tax=Aspergillus stella-maris TaxID=1810926 RepID=UPI003CCDBFA2